MRTFLTTFLKRPTLTLWPAPLAAMLLALVSLVANPTQAVATIQVIDDFYSVGSPSPWNLDLESFLEVNAAPVSYPTGGPLTETGLSHVLGGERRTRIHVTTNDFDPNNGSHQLTVSIVSPGDPAGANPGDPVNSFFNWDPNSGVMANLELGYSPTLGSGATKIMVNVRSHSAGGAELLADLFITQGINPAVQIPASSPNYPLNHGVLIADPDLPLEFDLAAASGINFANPVELLFRFQSSREGQDYSFKSITFESEETTSSVPEPSTWAMGIMGLIAFAGYALHRRGKRRADHRGEKSTTFRCNFLKNLALGCMAAALVALAESQASALIIDTFDDNPAPALNLTVAVGDAPDTNSQTSPVAGTVSNNRTATLTVMSGDQDAQATMRIIGALPNRRLSLSSEDSVIAKWNLDYVPLSSIDVTDGGIGTGVQVHFLSADHAATVMISLDVPGAGSPLTQTLAKAIGAEVLTFDFSAFVNSFAVLTPVTSSTLVNGIHVEVLGNTSGDYSIELIDTRIEHVPEPSTFVLAGLGLMGLAFWGWRYRPAKLTRTAAM